MIRDAGHEIGLHGYSHENPTSMSIDQQRDILDYTYKLLTDFCGKPPRGSVAPWWGEQKLAEPGAQGLDTLFDTLWQRYPKKEPNCSSIMASSTIIPSPTMIVRPTMSEPVTAGPR